MATNELSSLSVASSDEETLDEGSEVDISSETERESHSPPAKDVLSGVDRAKPAAISRQRSLLLNPPGMRKRKRCGPSTSLKRKSVHDCVKDNSKEFLSVEPPGVLFCNACRTAISQKASSLKRHMTSARHIAGKAQRTKEAERQQTIAKSLEKYSSEVHPKGETLPENERVYRVEVVETFLRAGVAFNKLAHFRPLLEKHGSRLGSRALLSQLIPMVLAKERDIIKTSIANKDVSIVFDGSTRLGEALVVVVRYIDDKWKVQQQLVRLKVLAKSLTGNQLAAELNETISTSLQINKHRVMATMRDGASVNGAAMRLFEIIYPDFIDITCFSHTIDRVGLHFELTTLDTFMNWWLQLFSRSAAAKLAWRERTGVTMPTCSATRWWSRWEVMKFTMIHFPHVQGFLDDNQDIAPRLSDHIRAIMEDEEEQKRLKMELAGVVDAGEPFVKATYVLEGDGLLVFSTYSALQALSTAAGQRHYPNVTAMAQQLSNTPQEAAQLKRIARDAVEPGIAYFLRKFNVQFHDVVRAFKAARMACPTKVQELKPTAADVEQLRLFKLFNKDDTITNLQQELPDYRAEADGVRIDAGDELQWWKSKAERLPCWSAAAKLLALVQPSSAAAERVFSLLAAAFNELQEGSLEDYLEAAVMLAYNYRNK